MTLLSARLLLIAATAGLALAAVSFFAAAASAQDQPPKEGDPAPAVSLPAIKIETVLPDKKDAKELNLKDFQGKKNVVLFFYPKAKTGGWTREVCAFRDALEQFAPLDTVVIGISTDTVKLQDEFSSEQKLTFPLLADTDKKVSKAFGVLQASGFAKRTTFVIDKKGTVRKIYEVKDIANHPAEVSKFIKDTVNK